MLLPHADPYHVHFAALQIAQAAVDEARGTAGSSGRKIILLQNQGPYTAPGAFTSNGHTVDAAADYHYIEFLVQELVFVLTHRQLDGRSYSGVIGKNFGRKNTGQLLAIGS